MVLSAIIALAGALAMRDRVRLVDILSLFFGGAGTGAGIVELLMRRRLAAREAEAARTAGAAAGPAAAPWGPPAGVPLGLHTPPTVPWAPEPVADRDRPPA